MCICIATMLQKKQKRKVCLTNFRIVLIFVIPFNSYQSLIIPTFFIFHFSFPFSLLLTLIFLDALLILLFPFFFFCIPLCFLHSLMHFAFRFAFSYPNTFCINYNPIIPATKIIKYHVFLDTSSIALPRKLK